jgi:DNA sulfur modification protein DndB
MPGPLFLPALQGSFGNWTYYSALVRLDDIAERVGYAHPLAENQSLSAQMQRTLDEHGRAEDIAQYLLRSEDRFFNALVVGVLGGHPKWHPFSLTSRVPAHELGAVTERDQDLVGYLQLTGEETLFALDGQHRLAGIRKALQERPETAREKLSLIFVPHIATPEGRIRTRSLFISLNKKAVVVKKPDIIILDEVDLAAIVTRRLIDQNPRFSRDVIDVERFTNAISTTSTYWTTIANFYDANKVIIEEIMQGRNEDELEQASKMRLAEDRIDFYMNGVIDFYDRLARLEPLLATIFQGAGNATSAALLEARTGRQPRLLARPIGLKIVVKVVAKLRETNTLAQAFRELRRVPLVMTRAPFSDLIWDTDRGRMQVKGEGLATRLIMYQLGLTDFDANLRRSYAAHIGEEPDEVSPPRRFPAAQ